MPNLIPNEDLAVRLGTQARTLVQVLKRTSKLYTELALEKKTGGVRTIKAPAPPLKTIQRTILDRILYSVPLPKTAFGFSKGRGIVENATLHAKSAYMLNIDIKDFFPSVHYLRIEEIFSQMGYDTPTVKALTKLTTLDHALPQGAPTSPYLATLALKRLDKRITKLCTVNRLVYSRYFDDITISGGKRAHNIIDKVEQIVKSEGYQVHKGKTRLLGPGDDKVVTGIVIKNGILTVPNIKEVTDYIDSLHKKGLKALLGDNPIKEQMSLLGKINFISKVSPIIGAQLQEEFNKIAW